MREVKLIFYLFCTWVALAGNAFAVAPENGWWWNPSESASGYAIERQGNSIFMSAFLYETSGVATWYATVLALQPDGTYKGDMTRFVGGKSLLGSYKSPTTSTVIATCRIPDDCIDSKRYPLFMAREVMRQLIDNLCVTTAVHPGALS